MAGLRGRQDVSMRLSRCQQINGGALHGPRVLEISHRAMVMSTQRHLSDVISETLSPCPVVNIGHKCSQPES